MAFLSLGQDVFGVTRHRTPLILSVPRKHTTPRMTNTATPTSYGPLKVVHGSPVQGAAVASAEEQNAGKVDVAEEEVALGGYDCVSYYAPGATSPVLGEAEHEEKTYNVVQGDVRYRFASPGNAEAFKTEPKHKYLPQFGGFCATGVAKNVLLHADPRCFSIAGDDDKLFLFCCDGAKQGWEGDFAKKRVDAATNWPKLAKGEKGADATTCCAECGCCSGAKATVSCDKASCDAAKSCCDATPSCDKASVA